MQYKSRRMAVKFIILLPYLLLLYILQATVFTKFPIFGEKPVLLPIAVVGIAIFDGKIAGGVVGIVCGALCDMTFNEPTVVFTLALCFLGLIVGHLGETIFVVGFPAYFIMSFCVLAVCAFIQIFALLFIRHQAAGPLIATAFHQTCGSMIFTIPIYYLTRLVSRSL